MRLAWTYSTLDDGKTGKDIIGKDPVHPRAYCRVYHTVANASGKRWAWSASDGNTDWGHGFAASRSEAAKAAEDAYFAKRDARR